MAVQFNHLPVTPLRVTSKFGPRNTGIAGASTYHKGIDLGCNWGLPQTPVQAVAAGTVTNNYWNDYRGWVVIIDHGDYKTLYQHLKSTSPLAKSSRVTAGQQLGIMGSSSNKSKLNVAVHLHMELIVGGVQIDPLPYLQNIVEVDELKIEDTTIVVGDTKVEAKLIDGVTYVPIRTMVNAIKDELEVTWSKAAGTEVKL